MGKRLKKVRTFFKWCGPGRQVRDGELKLLFIFQYESGEGARYMTRKAALRKLQLTLRDFRTLCIIKGIYPREPKRRRRAQHGKTGIQTLYLKKDIQFLAHEPLIWKLRQKKVMLVSE